MAGRFGSSLRVRPDEVPPPQFDDALAEQPGVALAVLAGGCFWCTEAVYLELEGVLGVTSGYSGGSADTADYETVCTGRTEHAEVIEIRYDPSRTSYGRLLRIFFTVAHDPTQLNRQGNDVGAQYRSAIFFGNERQHDIASRYIAQLERAGVFQQAIVTRLEPLSEFFEAEPYHHNYAARHPHQPYIATVAAPKLDKLRNYFNALRKAPARD